MGIAHRVKVVVSPTLIHKLLVSSHLCNPAVIKDYYLVSFMDGRETVSNNDGGAPFKKVAQGILDDDFSLSINVSCSFVED